MDERKKKAAKILIIILFAVLLIIAIVETGLLLSMRSKLDNLTNENSQIQERLENS